MIGERKVHGVACSCAGVGWVGCRVGGTGSGGAIACTGDCTDASGLENHATVVRVEEPANVDNLEGCAAEVRVEGCTVVC